MEWETVIGLEVHVELSTKTKIFCSCTTEFGGEPNTHCCPICMGFPGTLPVLNKNVLNYALKAGIALNCEILKNNRFDRKNYFYPDLPKAYQISQLYYPFARNGTVKIKTDSGYEKDIRIHEIHMEEDAGKLVHGEFETYPDYNRCGVPLIEIVSEPDFRSAEEVTAYLEKLRSTLKYLGVSDCKMQEGSLRCDVNLSVRPKGSEKFGTRTEMKNINSFRAIEHAIIGESKRQIEVIEDGGAVVQETRRWDDTVGESYAMRSKENAQDYRYFPEPDIPPILVTDELLAKLKEEQPELADEKKARYIKQFGISENDADILTREKNLAVIFEETESICGNAKEVCNWMLGQMMYLVKSKGILAEDVKLKPTSFAAFIKAISDGVINQNIGKTVFEKMFDHGEDFDVDAYIKENNLAMSGDEDELKATVLEVLSENPKAVQEYKAGKDKMFGFFVGQCMKKLHGKADPKLLNKLLNDELAK